MIMSAQDARGPEEHERHGVARSQKKQEEARGPTYA